MRKRRPILCGAARGRPPCAHLENAGLEGRPQEHDRLAQRADNCARCGELVKPFEGNHYWHAPDEGIICEGCQTEPEQLQHGERILEGLYAELRDCPASDRADIHARTTELEEVLEDMRVNADPKKVAEFIASVERGMEIAEREGKPYPADLAELAERERARLALMRLDG